MNDFKCPCCGIGYDGTRLDFEATFGRGRLRKVKDDIYECAVCNAEFAIGEEYPKNVLLYKKSLSKFETTFDPNILEKVANLSVADPAIVTKKGQQYLQVLTADGKQEFNIEQLLLLAELAKSQNFMDKYNEDLTTMVEYNKALEENEQIKNRFDEYKKFLGTQPKK